MGARRRNRALVLYRAGNGSALFLRELAQGSDAPYRVVGIIDDQGEHTGQRIQGVDVLGDWDQVETVLDRLAARGTPPQRLVMTRAEPNPDKLRQLVDLAQARGIELSRMPRLPALQKAEDGAAGPATGGDRRPLGAAGERPRPRRDLHLNLRQADW